MLALGIWESGLSRCGHHSSLTSDTANVFAIEETTCLVCASLARYGRVQAERDEKALKQLGEKPPAASARPGDGRTTFVRQLSPLEVAERRAALGRRAQEPETTST